MKKAARPRRGENAARAKRKASRPTLVTLAQSHLRQGRLAEARKLCEQALDSAPRDADALELLGIVRLQQGDTEGAGALFRKVADIRPSSVAALGNLATALIALRRHSEALAIIDSMLALDPGSVAAHVGRGVALHALGRNEEALASYRAAMTRDAANHDAANNAGTLLGAMGRHEEALAAYESALAARPDFPEATNNRGVSLAALERNDEALACYARAAALRAAYLDPRKNRAELLAKLGRNEEALAAYDQAIALAPRVAELISNRSIVLSVLNRHAEALSGYEWALQLKPGFTDALNNRGITLNALNRFEEALQCFRDAIAFAPEHVNAHWNESLTLLRLGRFTEGWQKHEWRWKKPEFAPHKLAFEQPLWLGKEELAGKTILLLSEQGYGDTVQFSRYVRLLEARGARVLLFVPEPLVALLRQSFPRAEVFSKTNAFPPFDFYCPLLSLPLAFGTQLDTIPAEPAYIVPPPDRLRKWARRIGASPEARVGLAWAGSATHKNDINRSIALTEFAPLLSLPGLRFYSLQKDLRGEDAARLAAQINVTPLGEEFADFSDTAGALAALDLVITVDTSIAHLAAAMGRPTWILLPVVSDWRWLPGRVTTPWYPAARLFLQEKIGDWPSVIERVRSELARLGPRLAEQRNSRAASTMPAAPATLTTPAAPQQAIGLDQAVRQAVGFLRAGNLTDAEAISRAVLQLQADHPDALAALGSVRLQQRRAAEAVELFGRVLDRRPDNLDAMLNLAGALRLAERHLDALPWYERALAVAPDNPNVHTNQGVSLIALQRYEEAAKSIDKALALDPGNLAALNNQGVVLNELGRNEEALAAFDRALAIKPDYSDALNNRGLALISLNRPADAEDNYRRTLQMRPGYADSLNNLGLALSAMNRNAEAIECFREAQRLKPDYADAHWNESLINLALGNYADGWREYEWRWKKPEFAPHKREFHVPAWTGREPLEGRTIFVHFEQGLGDTIQFVRYADLLRARGAKVIVSVPEPLRPLLRESFPAEAFFCGGEVLPPFDCHASMLSLPLAFGTTVETIPSRPAYLRAPADRLRKWRDRMGKHDDPRVGLAWAGNPKHRNDRNRSLPAEALRPLLHEAGVRFYSLQRDMRAEDRAALGEAQIELLGGELEDFADTAAAIMQLDLVICVDTAVAHLAGALGKPVWILLPFAADWRWLVGREDSPWYPGARLFRQPRIGAVAPLIESVRAALRPGLRK